MKLSEIVEGAEYLLVNGREHARRTRGRVVAVGCPGIVRGDWGSHFDKALRYVLVEPTVTDEDAKLYGLLVPSFRDFGRPAPQTGKELSERANSERYWREATERLFPLLVVPFGAIIVRPQVVQDLWSVAAAECAANVKAAEENERAREAKERLRRKLHAEAEVLLNSDPWNAVHWDALHLPLEVALPLLRSLTAGQLALLRSRE